MPLCLVLSCFVASISMSAGASHNPSRAALATPDLKLEPIEFKLRDGSTIAAEQGSFEVPEQRSDPSSRRITIRFVRFKSTSPTPGPPTIYLAGGPGGSGIDAAHGPRQPMFLKLRAAGDVIALDQRGTGLSNAIPPCTATLPLDPLLGLSEASLTHYHQDTLATCLRTWRSAGVAIGGYNTEESADDIASLSKALDAPKIRLWGISYGTHLALATMRRHPNIIDRVVMASVEGMDQTVKLPKATEAAFERISRAGKEDLTALMRRVHARLDRQPATLSVETAQGPLRFTMDSFALRMIAGGIAKNPSGIARLAGLYAMFDQTQEQALAPMIHGMFFKDPLVMSGMPELMDLASGVSWSRLKKVERQAHTALLSDAINFPMPQIASVAGKLDLSDAFRREIRSSIPTLVFSGDLDVRTPLEEQASATAGLRQLTTIIVENGGHDLFEADPRIAELSLAFLSGASVDATPLRLERPIAAPGS